MQIIIEDEVDGKSKSNVQSVLDNQDSQDKQS
jgi:hypothetical protein